jgi:hypothetical protein
LNSGANGQTLLEIQQALDELIETQKKAATASELSAIKSQLTALSDTVDGKVLGTTGELAAIKTLLTERVDSIHDSLTELESILGERIGDAISAVETAISNAKGELLEDLQGEIGYVQNSLLEDLKDAIAAAKSAILDGDEDSEGILGRLEDLENIVNDIATKTELTDALADALVTAKENLFAELGNAIANPEQHAELFAQLKNVGGITDILSDLTFLKNNVVTEANIETHFAKAQANLLATVESLIKNADPDKDAAFLAKLQELSGVGAILEDLEALGDIEEKIDILTDNLATLKDTVDTDFENLNETLAAKEKLLTDFIEQEAIPHFLQLAKDVTDLRTAFDTASENLTGLGEEAIAVFKTMQQEITDTFAEAKEEIDGFINGKGGVIETFQALQGTFESAYEEIRILIEGTDGDGKRFGRIACYVRRHRGLV